MILWICAVYWLNVLEKEDNVSIVLCFFGNQRQKEKRNEMYWKGRGNLGKPDGFDVKWK